jgi:hypothetical protein
VTKQHALNAVLVTCVFSAVVWPGAVGARDAGEVLGELAQVMKTTGQADRKQALLAEVGQISSMNALDAAIAAMADKEATPRAYEAAGRIARSLMDPGQPPYVRRSAYLRWVGCQPEEALAGTLFEALRGDDFVRQSAAVSLLHEGDNTALLGSVARELTSFHPDARKSLIELFAGRADTSLLPVLLDIVRQSESEAEKAMALRGVAKLAVAARSPEDRATLLKALKLMVERVGKELTGEGAIAAVVQIAQALAATHPGEARGALDKLAACKLDEAARQHVRGALLLSTIDQLPNLARGAKASSPDGFECEGGSSGDAAAIDGKEATYWDETDGHPLYKLRVDLPQASDISAISIKGWGHHSFSPKDFKIVCDGKTVRTVSGATYADNRLIVPFPRTSCKSLELQISGYYGGSPAVRELGIHDAP